ncbi:MAG: hypothetical protein HC886_19755 [Leptolyngbyaceae cyanobacterium SM1_1_3]|nr:hypothetical protein [Leptolyngbyaceae cyanobacterium SM1_1_3]NJN04947.1 hypothetical protein [Leptolyngbyaceae cyanobacterium RM1_1_2]NJO10998.1 hypothetical protein [Leptolyngbyaceae cyanobacterium SL_1_1]
MDFNTKTRLQSASLHEVSCLEQIQIALAIANQSRLRSLLLNSQPALLSAHQLGAVTVHIGVPVEQESVRTDAVLDYEAIQCILTDTWAVAKSMAEKSSASQTAAQSPYSRYRPHEAITRYHSELQTLGENLSLPQAIALLSQAGFGVDQVSAVLNLPQAGWHKSWWYRLDEMGDFTIPFQRHLRTRSFADGTYTLQYRDYYPQSCPPCFKSQRRRVPLLIKVAQTSFWETLKILNHAKAALKASQAIIIGENIPDLELQGYIHQGISVFSSEQLMPNVAAANAAVSCARCDNCNCPLCGKSDSPVTACGNFEPRLGSGF